MNATIDMTKFCAKDDARFLKRFGAPFVLDRHRYACDGKICIRIPDTDANSATDEPSPVKDLFKQFAVDESAAWYPFPTEFNWKIGDVKCEKCLGHGDVDREECSSCQGTGTVECGECGNETDCEECEDGFVGGTPCTECAGTGSHTDRVSAVIGGRIIGAEYIDLILSLPGVMFSDTDKNNPESPLRFKFDGGGEGLVMPRRE